MRWKRIEDSPRKARLPGGVGRASFSSLCRAAAWLRKHQGCEPPCRFKRHLGHSPLLVDATQPCSFPLEKGDHINGKKGAFHTSSRGVGLKNTPPRRARSASGLCSLEKIQGRPAPATSRLKNAKIRSRDILRGPKAKVRGPGSPLGPVPRKIQRKLSISAFFPYFFPSFLRISVLFPYFFRISVLFPYFFSVFFPQQFPAEFPHFRTFSVLFPPSVSAADFGPKMGFRAAASPQTGQGARPVA